MTRLFNRRSELFVPTEISTPSKNPGRTLIEILDPRALRIHNTKNKNMFFLFPLKFCSIN